MLEVLIYYVKRGARVIRLDAIAYLWKEIGTSCIHLPQVHYMVKLFRFVVNSINPETIIVDSKSGVTGAGRTPSMNNVFSEVGEQIKAYNIAQHRHIPEMEEQLKKLSNKRVNITFVAHLVPYNRGILSTIYADLNSSISEEKLFDIFEGYYSKELFIRILKPPTIPSTGNVRGTNFCDIGFVVRDKKIIIFSCLDNLVKGASGNAVQNMNIMLGFDEKEGLL